MKYIICISMLLLSLYSVKAYEDPNQQVLKQGLLGAITGAVAADQSGGKAGKGALIGAGTNVLGGALLDTLTNSSPQGQPAPVYAQPYYTPQGPNSYIVQQPVYYQQQPVYYQQPTQQDHSKEVLKQGLLGALTGAVAADQSGGKAGKGALIGAGTNVLGGALLDTLTNSSPQGQPVPVYAQPYNYRPSPNAYMTQQPVYYQQQPVYYQQRYYQSSTVTEEYAY